MADTFLKSSYFILDIKSEVWKSFDHCPKFKGRMQNYTYMLQYVVFCSLLKAIYFCNTTHTLYTPEPTKRIGPAVSHPDQLFPSRCLTSV